MGRQCKSCMWIWWIYKINKKSCTMSEAYHKRKVWLINIYAKYFFEKGWHTILYVKKLKIFLVKLWIMTNMGHFESGRLVHENNYAWYNVHGEKYIYAHLDIRKKKRGSTNSDFSVHLLVFFIMMKKFRVPLPLCLCMYIMTHSIS